MSFMTPKEKANFIFGQEMSPCPKCGSYNIHIQTPVKIDLDNDDFDNPKKIVGKWVNIIKSGIEGLEGDYLEGPCFIMCFDCHHKGPSLDCSGRTSTDIGRDPVVMKKTIKLWNKQEAQQINE